MCGTVLPVICFTATIINYKSCLASHSTEFHLSAEDSRIFSWTHYGYLPRISNATGKAIYLGKYYYLLMSKVC